MSIYFTILLTLLTWTFSYGQTAVIRGDFTLLKSLPDSTSETLFTIHKDYVFYINRKEEQPTDSNWIYITVSSDNICTSLPRLYQLKGYIPKNNIDELINHIHYGNNITYNIINKPYYHEEHEVGYTLCGPVVNSIDGNHPYGLTSNVPDTEIDHIQLSIQGKSIHFPYRLTQDLFNFKTKFTSYRKGETFFIEHWQEGFLGRFILVWVIRDGKIIQRFICNEI